MLARIYKNFNAIMISEKTFYIFILRITYVLIQRRIIYTNTTIHNICYSNSIFFKKRFPLINRTF